LAYPTLYDVTYSYTGFQQAQGNNSFPGTQLDADLAGLQATIDNVEAFLQLAIRSDGALNNGIVTFDSLSAVLQSNGLAGANSWATGIGYLAGVPVYQAGGLYRCLIPHTSGVFATDLAAGDWLLLVQLPAGNSFRQGAGAPGAGLGTDGDSYLNVTTSDIYSRVAGVWSIVSNIKGLQGIQGVIGPQGVIGNTGPAAWLPPVAWLTATNYTVGPPASVVTFSGETYVCLITHTSGVFATDLAAGKWIKVAQKGTGDLLSTNNLSDLTNAGTARANLGLAIGTNVQAFDPQLTSTIRQNSQSAAYTTVLADAEKHIFHPSSDVTARTWTIDSNANVAYPIGTALTFVNQNGASVITLAITTDTLRLAVFGTTGSRTLAANGIATALKVTATEWLISGSGLS
jgi:hypothetical protein